MAKKHHNVEYRKMRGVSIWLHDDTCGFNGCLSKSDEVHHIDKNPSNNDIQNLIPLCSPHHKIVHLAQISFNYDIKRIIVLLLKKVVSFM